MAIAPTVHHVTLQTSQYGLYATTGAIALDAVTLANNTADGAYFLQGASGSITNAIVAATTAGSACNRAAASA